MLSIEMDIDPPDSGSKDISLFETVHDLDIEALIDNELTPVRKQAVLTAMSLHSELRQKYDKLSRQKDALKEWWMRTSHNT